MRYLKNFENYNPNTLYTNESVAIGDIYTESEVYSYAQQIHKNEEDFYEGDLGERIESFPRYQVAEIPLDKICIDEYELDDDYVDDYIKKYEELKTYPPIILGYYDSNWGYNIIDGNHRVNALHKMGITSVICLVGLNSKQKEVLKQIAK